MPIAPTDRPACTRLRALAILFALASLCTASLAQASPSEPRRWLMGYHKALFSMSETEVRFFYDIAEAFTPGDAPGAAAVERAGGRSLKLIAATTAPFAGVDWRVDFLMRRGRLTAIGLEHVERTTMPEVCRLLLDDWLSAVERLHGAADETAPERASLLFRRGARWDIATAYDDGACRTRMQLSRTPPARR